MFQTHEELRAFENEELAGTNLETIASTKVGESNVFNPDMDALGLGDLEHRGKVEVPPGSGNWVVPT